MKRYCLAAFLLVCFLSAPQIQAAERPVTVTGTDGATLAGTLLLPDGSAPAQGWPAILLVQGSGPTDRNGNSAMLPDKPIDLLKQLAEALAGKGIASLRLDKRGMQANAAQMPHDPAAMAQFFRWGAFVGDLAAAYDALGREDGINGAKRGVMGHSEGGALVLAAIDEGRISPAAIVLLGTASRPLGDVIADQLRAQMTRANVPEPPRKAILEADGAIRREIVSTGQVPAQVPPGLRGLYPAYIGPFMQGALSLNPLGALAKVKAPVLVVNGGDDIQISAEKDAGPFQKALVDRQDGSSVAIRPGLSHNLKENQNGGFTGPVEPATLTLITSWVSQHLAQK